MTHPIGSNIRYCATVPAPLTTPTRSDALRNRERVVATAATMRERGEPLQLNVVARHAGVGVGTVYRHFSTVAQLTEALVHQRFDEMQTRAAAIVDDDDLGDFLEQALTVFVHDDDFAEVATNPAPALQQTADAKARLLAALSAAIGRVEGRRRLAGTLTPADVLVLLCGVAHAIRIGGTGPDRTRSYLDALLRGTFTAG